MNKSNYYEFAVLLCYFINDLHFNKWRVDNLLQRIYSEHHLKKTSPFYREWREESPTFDKLIQMFPSLAKEKDVVDGLTTYQLGLNGLWLINSHSNITNWNLYRKYARNLSKCSEKIFEYAQKNLYRVNIAIKMQNTYAETQDPKEILAHLGIFYI